MIDLKECQTLHVMPEVFRKDVKVQAASHALWQTMQVLLKQIDCTSVYARIDFLSEPIVDLLAQEMRAQYYDVTLSIKDKREAVKKALPWHKRAGTVSAVMELCEFRYGRSIVREWFDYGGRPYTFRLEMLQEARLLDIVEIESFIKAVKAVKNTRSLLEALIFHRSTASLFYSGVAVMSYTRQAIVDFFADQVREDLTGHSAGKANEAYRKQVVTDFETVEKSIDQDIMSGIILTAEWTEIITED